MRTYRQYMHLQTYQYLHRYNSCVHACSLALIYSTVYIYIHTHTLRIVSVRTHIYIYTHTVHTRVYICICFHIYIYIYIYVCNHMVRYMYAYTVYSYTVGTQTCPCGHMIQHNIVAFPCISHALFCLEPACLNFGCFPARL